jgi:hypothetical protein
MLSGYILTDKSATATQSCRIPTSLQEIKNGNISRNLPGMMFACHQIATEQNLAQLAAFKRHVKLQAEGCKDSRIRLPTMEQTPRVKTVQIRIAINVPYKLGAV